MTPPSPRDRQREREAQHENQLHNMNLQGEADTPGPETLREISEIEDAPDLGDDTLDHQTSKVVSTANLDESRVDGIEWENEIAMLRRRQANPPSHGITGHDRAWVKGDDGAYKEPLDPEDRIKHEGHGLIAKLAVTRSEDFKGVETSTRDTTESIVRGKDDGGNSGILGRFRG